MSYRWEVLRVLAGRSHDVSDWSKTFNVDTLSFEELTTFVSVRDAMHKLALWIEIFDKDDVLNDTVFIKELTTLILPRIKALKQLDEV